MAYFGFKCVEAYSYPQLTLNGLEMAEKRLKRNPEWQHWKSIIGKAIYFAKNIVTKKIVMPY